MMEGEKGVPKKRRCFWAEVERAEEDSSDLSSIAELLDSSSRSSIVE